MTVSLRARPHSAEFAPFYQPYIALVPDGDLVELLRAGGRELHDAIRSTPEQRGAFRYAEGKWSIREVLGHLIDAERIFTYRALRFARGDTTALPGFDENTYVPASGAEARTLASLGHELDAVRESTVQLFQSLPDEAWTRRGVSNGAEISVRALAFIVAGHSLHHFRILRQRYLIG